MRFIYLVTLLLLLLFFSTLKYYSTVEQEIIIEVPQDTITTVVPEPEPVDTIIVLPEPIDTTPSVLPHIYIARLSIGIPPVDSIRTWMNFVGFTERDPFCAGAQSWWLHKADVASPRLKTALARNFVYQVNPSEIVLASKVLRGEIEMPAGSLVVYQNGDTRFGHVGTLTQPMRGARGVYISANTSAPGSSGSIASGGGVWEKDFSIIPGAKLAVRELVYVRY